MGDGQFSDCCAPPYYSGVPILKTLLAHAIDYAGLFPPASHPMAEAVREYREIQDGDEAWALGRFVVPAARLQEFRDARGGAWQLAAIAGAELAKDMESIARFNAQSDGAKVDTAEFRALTPDALREAIGTVPAGLQRFAEWPLGSDPAPFVAVVQGTGVHAKFRTGGIVEDAFPEANILLGHLAAVIAAGIPFKCTAGLHHPVRGQYRLTYEPGSAQGRMFGYLNVMLAAAALQKGLGLDTARAILLEEDRHAMQIGDESVDWNGVTFGQDDLSRLRSDGFQSFGSCSFREPIDELQHLSRLTAHDS